LARYRRVCVRNVTATRRIAFPSMIPRGRSSDNILKQ
jgi:hypothetical protein